MAPTGPEGPQTEAKAPLGPKVEDSGKANFDPNARRGGTAGHGEAWCRAAPCHALLHFDRAAPRIDLWPSPVCPEDRTAQAIPARPGPAPLVDLTNRGGLVQSIKVRAAGDSAVRAGPRPALRSPSYPVQPARRPVPLPLTLAVAEAGPGDRGQGRRAAESTHWT